MRSARIPPESRESGFTLIEIVLALSLFAIIVVNILADREKSLRIAGDARIIQIVRYLAQSKIDEIRHDPEEFGESDAGDFTDLNNDWQNFDAYSWELDVKRLVVVGAPESGSEEYLFPEDKDESPEPAAEGETSNPRYVRRLTLIVRFEPGGEPRPELSIQIMTFIPDAEEETP